MDQLYVIQNQHQHYLSKQGEWVDGSDNQILFRTAHKDEAINIKVEHAVRSPELRLKIVSVTTNDKGRIQLASAPSTQSIDSAANDSFTAPEQDSTSKEELIPSTPSEENPDAIDLGDIKESAN